VLTGSAGLEGDAELVGALVVLLGERRERVPQDAVVTWTWDRGAAVLRHLWDAPGRSVPEVVGEQP
jgi:hypothetical protein